MNPVSPWIAALADQCLSFYLGQNDQNDQDEIQVEDFEGCLIFIIRRPTLNTAVVVSWGQGEDSHRATFTDSKNQIDAIILRDSPDAQGPSPPCPPSVKGGPRHLVELSDIKLIFTYSASVPDVYLHVNRFTIRPNAVSRGDVPKPKLRKTPALRTLMTMACAKIQKPQRHPGSKNQPDTGLTDPSVSQPDQPMPPHHSQNDSTSQLLFSQPPSNMRHGAPKDTSMANRIPINGSLDLLGLLAPSRQIQTNGSATRELPETRGLSLGERKSERSPLPNGRKSVALQEIDTYPTGAQYSPRSLFSNTADATRASESTPNVSLAAIKQGVDDLIAECLNQVEPDESVDHGRAHTVGTGHDLQFSKKRHRGNTDAPSQAARDDNLGSQYEQSPNASPSKKRQRIDAGEVMPTAPTESEQVQNKAVPSLPRVHIVSTKTDSVCPSTTNPWEGMTRIPLSEVDIPKDQAGLLDELKWIPQDPGVSAPLCHVPPYLLAQWNGIARRREHLAEKEAEAEAEAQEEQQEQQQQEEEEEQVSERAFTPSQDIQTSPIPWSPSPNRTPPARDVLPRDTASPPRYMRPTRKAPTPRGTQCSVYPIPDNDNMGIVNGSCNASFPPGKGDVVASKGRVKAEGQQCSQSPEEATTKPNPVSLGDVLGDGPSQQHNAPTSLNVLNDQPPSLAQQDSRREQPAENPPSIFGPRDESSGDESDEPEMETYVPFALGSSLPLSSQPEHEIASSGPALPGFARGTIQVMETPAVHAARLKPDKQNKQRVGLEPQGSQAAITSSSSRILNTYRSQDSRGQSDPSQEAPNPSLPILEDQSLRVDVLGTQTQTSSMHAPSQATVQSSSDVVLDSSRPAQRQRGSSIFHLDPSDDPSSFPYAGCHSLPTSQPHEPSQNSSRGPFSLDGPSQLPQLSPIESTTWVAAHGESPSKRSRLTRRESADTAHKTSCGPNVELVARRQGFLGKSDKYAEAQTIYEKFCNDYSPYSGDFAHFVEMCSKLQEMRQRGQLQRSFLWDDFVIQHLDEYPRYFVERTSQESKALDYEDFFCSTFSRPRHKKRSLTAHGVHIVASQFMSPTRKGEVTQDKVVQSEVANTSSTGSLIGEISTLHARSSRDIPAPDGYMPTTTQSSSSSGSTCSEDSVEIKVESEDSSDGSINSQICTSSDKQAPALSNPDEEIVDATQYDADNSRIAPHLNDADMTKVDIDSHDEIQDGDNTHHETASIELGDETDDRRISTSPAPSDPPTALGSLNNAAIEPPRQRRPWFRSLRNIYPTGPVWSDDPNTPLKRWARQDQNVLQELNRRGGARISLDEKGVIRRPIYTRGKNPDP
ncbi:uncharacterized protein PGRI_040700 [Penicillium griseofulvum]|uniref:Telomere replication protein EST3 n=1 Tax=Penicillium patulum TaxID=5078 RepID=A0A135L871_PENPA|nr:uncharacterized protein PGRI_040700 [Penicillium griseofulvum]KXG45157.1 hypothetical protein PGRI_040700 [Penicillium griseofulvum]